MTVRARLVSLLPRAWWDRGLVGAYLLAVLASVGYTAWAFAVHDPDDGANLAGVFGIMLTGPVGIALLQLATWLTMPLDLLATSVAPEAGHWVAPVVAYALGVTAAAVVNVLLLSAIARGVLSLRPRRRRAR